MNRKAAVLVAGSWGTALAAVLADNNFDVTLWARSNRPSRGNKSQAYEQQILAGCHFAG